VDLAAVGFAWAEHNSAARTSASRDLAEWESPVPAKVSGQAKATGQAAGGPADGGMAIGRTGVGALVPSRWRRRGRITLLTATIPVSSRAACGRPMAGPGNRFMSAITVGMATGDRLF
jgi:hypothetical protein